jgi:hypothetical protein
MQLLSKYLKNSKPARCAFELCGKPFGDSCFHGQDGSYYCDTFCFEEAQYTGWKRIERAAARTVN